QIITDRETGRSRGFGFVEMPNAAEAQAAMAGLDGRSLGGRLLTVTEARPREERDGPRAPRAGGCKASAGNTEAQGLPLVVPSTTRRTEGDGMAQRRKTSLIIRLTLEERQ